MTCFKLVKLAGFWLSLWLLAIIILISRCQPIEAKFTDQVKINLLNIKINFQPINWQVQAFVDDFLINEFVPTSNFEINNNQAEIDLSNNSQPLKTICFDYQINSYDQPPFDNPVFNINANNQNVFKVSSQDLSNNNYQTNWQKIGLDISKFNNPVFEFSCFNSLDQFNPSWVKIKNLTSQCAVINQQSQISFSVQPKSSLVYQVKPNGENSQENSWQTYVQPIRLDGFNQGWYQIYYQAVKNSQKSEIKSFQIFLQTTQPDQLDCLNIKPTDKSALLSWSNNQTDQYLNYQFKYHSGDCQGFNPEQADVYETGYWLNHQPVYELEINNLDSNQEYCLTAQACSRSDLCTQPAEYMFSTF